MFFGFILWTLVKNRPKGNPRKQMAAIRRPVARVANSGPAFSGKTGPGCYWTLKKLHRGWLALVLKTSRLVLAENV